MPVKDIYKPLTRNQMWNIYQDVFEELGSFAGEYKIEIDSSAKPKIVMNHLLAMVI